MPALPAAKLQKIKAGGLAYFSLHRSFHRLLAIWKTYPFLDFTGKRNQSTASMQQFSPVVTLCPLGLLMRAQGIASYSGFNLVCFQNNWFLKTDFLSKSCLLDSDQDFWGFFLNVIYWLHGRSRAREFQVSWGSVFYLLPLPVSCHIPCPLWSRANKLILWNPSLAVS